MAKRANGSRAERRAFWQAVIKQHQASGRSVRAFCRDEGLSEPSFYAWRRKLTCEAGQAAGPGAGFVSLGTLRLEETFVGVEVILDAPLRVRVGPGFDTATLGEVLAVLANPSGIGERGRPC